MKDAGGAGLNRACFFVGVRRIRPQQLSDESSFYLCFPCLSLHVKVFEPSLST